MHVRESHFALTDVPTTALVVLTLWLTVVAGRKRTVSAYAWAGFAAGLSAAAKNNGAVVAVAIGLAWLTHQTTAPDRGRKALAAIAAMTRGLPAGRALRPPRSARILERLRRAARSLLASQSVRERRFALGVPYPVFLSQAGTFWLPLSRGRSGADSVATATLEAMGRSSSGSSASTTTSSEVTEWLSVAMPCPLCPASAFWPQCRSLKCPRIVQEHISRRHVASTSGGVGHHRHRCRVRVRFPGVARRVHRPDTRAIASRWMIAALPKGTRIVAENAGPTNLRYDGFRLLDQPNAD